MAAKVSWRGVIPPLLLVLAVLSPAVVVWDDAFVMVVSVLW